MDRRSLLKTSTAGVAAAAMCRPGQPSARERLPNFIVILCDDLGYGDVGFNGRCAIQTPSLDQMAREGTVLTNYYAPANLCTPSRASLLTGRYAIRSGLAYEVIQPQDDRGLPLSEITIPRALGPDYVSGLFGKWHLGHTPAHWPPTRYGFQSFYGLPYSHDMKPLSLFEAHAGSDAVKQSPVDFPRLQQDFYAHAEQFIEANKDRPFFVELALSAPHLPEHPGAGFNQHTSAGAYGAVVAEIDAIVGRLLSRLKTLGLDRDTLVIFTSDNGPWFEGSPGPFRERKGGAGYDGGYRVPFVARWPGVIPDGRRVESIAMGIDILPTLCALAGRPTPASVDLDGRDLSAVLTRGAPSPHEQLILFDNQTPVAIRTPRWKYVGAAYYRSLRAPLDAFGLHELYDVQVDPGENYSVDAIYPEVAADLQRRLAKAREDFAPMKQKEIPPIFLKIQDMARPYQD
jgi:arylsulfatase A-like enzyme